MTKDECEEFRKKLENELRLRVGADVFDYGERLARLTPTSIVPIGRAETTIGGCENVHQR